MALGDIFKLGGDNCSCYSVVSVLFHLLVSFDASSLHKRDSSLFHSSTHHYADGEVGEVFESPKQCWSPRGKTELQPKFDTIEVNCDLFFRRNKTR